MHLHPYRLPLTLHPACLQVEAPGSGLSRRCSRALTSGSFSGIARYATISDTRLGDHVFSKEPLSFQNPYPYPTHAKPTPHQIFHLGPGATQDEIKRRCTSPIYNISFHLDSISFLQSKQQTTISFVYTTQIHVMPVFPRIIQKKRIRDFDL